MHYYQFNIGDYASHTQHLDPIEDIAYRRMIDIYYLNECPLPEEPKEVARLIRMRSHCDVIADVLREFFTLIEGEWRLKRADEEIERYREKSEKAKKSAEARWRNKGGNGDADALRTESEGNAKHKPITNNQETITKEEPTDESSISRFSEFWDIFADKRGKDGALRVWKRKKLDKMADEVIDGARLYASTRGDDRRYWKQAQGWLNDGRWKDKPLAVTETKDRLPGESPLEHSRRLRDMIEQPAIEGAVYEQG
jgi:uncharacterized protein YdaU (DUF1376 family)